MAILFSFAPLRTLLRLVASCIIVIHTCSCASAQIPQDVSPPMARILDACTIHMNNSRYDSAQYLLSAAFQQEDFKVNENNLYYLYSYEAEILYYNALFDQGLNSSLMSLEIANRLKNPLLIGNSENLTGLFLMNLTRNDEAVSHFKKAINYLPEGKNLEWLSFRYHALGNLGECYFKLHLPDSAIFYSLASLREAKLAERNRGAALAQWNIAESYLQKGETNLAKKYALNAFMLEEKSSDRDVVQMLSATLMRVYQAEKNKDSTLYWQDVGLAEMNNELNTDFSRMNFYQQLIERCIADNELENGVKYLRELKKMEDELNSKQQSQRMQILKDYYEKNQKLILSKELDSAQKEELKLRQTISLILGLVLLLLIIIGLIIYRNSRQRQALMHAHHAEELKHLEEIMELRVARENLETLRQERDRIGADLHDDIGATLSGILIYASALRKKLSSEQAECIQLTDKISHSSAALMESMSDIIWSLHPKHDAAESLILRMKAYSGQILGTGNMQVNYHIAGDVEQLSLNMIARKNIYLVFKEAIHNIYKYSGANRVEVTLIKDLNTLQLEVKDNGTGFSSEVKGSGNGLVNMRRRTESLGGEFDVSSSQEKGTTIKARFAITRISDLSGLKTLEPQLAS